MAAICSRIEGNARRELGSSSLWEEVEHARLSCEIVRTRGGSGDAGGLGRAIGAELVATLTLLGASAGEGRARGRETGPMTRGLGEDAEVVAVGGRARAGLALLVTGGFVAGLGLALFVVGVLVVGLGLAELFASLDVLVVASGRSNVRKPLCVLSRGMALGVGDETAALGRGKREGVDGASVMT